MNLLKDCIITVEQGTGIRTASLPELLSNLIVGSDIKGFPRLATEQRGYWWRFLVRCASRAVRTGWSEIDEVLDLPADALAPEIQKALLHHTAPTDWELYQPDPTLPGFLQVPTPSGALPEDDGYKRNTGALLTAIIGTKEHERKSQIQRTLDPEQAVFALVEYQGGVIFGGRGNYESQITGSRSGAGSGTPFMGVWIDHAQGASFRHDVRVMLDQWDTIRQDRGLQGNVWALWTERWDGATGLPAHRLDPAFIPFARRVRLGTPTDGRFDTVWFLSSERSRIVDHTGGGHLGDPFTPLVPSADGPLKVRGTLQSGYDYREVVKLLFPENQETAVPSPSVRAVLSDPPLGARDVRVIFEGLAFEQGKTRGFHRRVVRLPLEAVRRGFLSYQFDPIHTAHRRMLEDTGTITRRALQSALALVLTGDPRAKDNVRKKLHAVLDRFESEVDRVYLDFLFDAAARQAGGKENWQRRYRQWLFDLAVRQLLPLALASLPRSEGRRVEEEVRADAYLRGRLRRELELDDTQDEPQQTEAA